MKKRAVISDFKRSANTASTNWGKVCFLLMLCGPAGPAVHGDQSAEYFTSMTASDADAVLREMKLRTGRTENRVTFELNEHPVILIVQAKNLQIAAVFSGRKATLAWVNEWNRSKRFSRAYLDREGDAVLTSDLDLEGGVSRGAVREFVNTFGSAVRAFRAHLSQGR